MSILWKHFTDEGCEKVRCNYCDVIVSYKKGNRSIMRKHLEHKHPEALGITTQAMAIDFASNSDESIHISEIHPVFQIESNIKYFIQMIYERPTLYEFSRLVGWNSKQNKIIWQEIADAFQVELLDCQKFWKYLKETYDLHNKNPRLDDHKYAKELSFLNEMYKKRRQRREELARQRKILKTYDNLEQQIINSDNINSNYAELEKQENENIIYDDQSFKNHAIESIENYEIYEYNDTSSVRTQTNDNYYINYSDHQYATNIDENHQYIIECDSQYKIEEDEDVKQWKAEDNKNELENTNKFKVEDIVVFDTSDLSFTDDKTNIINLKNASTQTNHADIFSDLNHHKNTKTNEPLSNCKKCLNEFDELDLLMEFIKGKIRKLPNKDINELQIKILKTVMEAENDSRKQIFYENK